MMLRVFQYARTNKIECVASVLGATGAILLSVNGDFSKFAWVLYLFSNLLFVIMGLRKRMFGFLGLQAYFSITSLIGIINYF